MTILKGYYNPEDKRLTIEFSSNLLQEHYEVLDKIVSNNIKSGKLPKGVEIQKLEDSKCLIMIYIDIPNENLKGIPKDLIEKISSTLTDFKYLALRIELGETEFIPLNGYPLKDLQKDIIDAIKNKRNFCIIDEFSEYERFSRKETNKLKQCKVMYSSNDYSEVAISIYEGNLKSLREQYSPRLKEIEWG